MLVVKLPLRAGSIWPPTIAVSSCVALAAQERKGEEGLFTMGCYTEQSNPCSMVCYKPEKNATISLKK